MTNGKVLLTLLYNEGRKWPSAGEQNAIPSGTCVPPHNCVYKDHHFLGSHQVLGGKDLNYVQSTWCNIPEDLKLHLHTSSYTGW
jgi:hypothetical protein